MTSRLLKSDYSRDVTHYLSVMHKGEQGAVATVEEGAPVLQAVLPEELKYRRSLRALLAKPWSVTRTS